MSRIENLLLKHCPDGVEYRTLGELEDAHLVKLGRGAVISKTDLMDYPGGYPVYSSSASLAGEFGRYGKYMFDDERITWSIDGGGRFFYRPPHRYSVTNVCGWMTVDREVILTRFLYYALISAWAGETFDYTRKAHPSVIRNVYRVPLPPLEVQREIVRVLDLFQSLEAELEAELEARKKKYAHYRDSLLNFNEQGGVRMSRIDDLIAEHCPNGVRYRSVNDFADCVVGGTPSTGNPLFWDEGTIPWMKSGEVNESIIFETDNWITQLGYDSCTARLVPAGSVVIALAGQGKTRGLVARTRIELSTNQSLCAITPDESVDSDFLYFFLSTQYQRLRELSSGDGSRGGLNLSMIRNYQIPVPPLEVQREIVRVLDLFQSLEAELEVELEVREKQYEHYRDRLLTFEEVA